MLSPKNNWLIQKISPYWVIWLLGGLIYFLLEKGLLGDAITYPATGNFYSPKASFITINLTGSFLGIVLGLVEETLFKNLLRKWPFLVKFVLKTVLYLIIIFIILIVTSFILNSALLSKPFSDPEVRQLALVFLESFVFVSILVYLSAVIGISLFFSEMVDHIGLNVIISFFTGKYAKSIVEERIFMFLDMRSSTSIAEKLGHEKYYRLLNSYYEDMTDAIVSTAGEIYQYIGDEIVVSWKHSSGLKNNNCIKCFFRIKKKLEARSSYYMEQFGVIPEFKAGLHWGPVSTGEVGVLKKEILFTGDVLNTTARIQGLCNELETNLLISEELKSELALSNKYHVEDKGAYELRGRNQRVTLFAVSRN
ncbi:MAG: adenylate/guanylate cyclase domain-containing protein [Bacteroidota bacterium]